MIPGSKSPGSGSKSPGTSREYSFLPAAHDRSPEKSGFVFPGPRDRVTINGKTGSGKTTFAMWLFAESADFDRKPWIILDYKKEEPLFIEGVSQGLFRVIKVTAHIPRQPGIYIIRPSPAEQDDVTALLWRIYTAGRCGLFLDEATMVPELRGEANSGGPFQSILSQGRSKEIPVYVLAQRPVNVNNMVFSENDFYSAFRLRSDEDFKKVVRHIPKDSHNFEKVWGANVGIRGHYSRWYDDKRDRSFILRPCPPPKKIAEILFARVDKLQKGASI